VHASTTTTTTLTFPHHASDHGAKGLVPHNNQPKNQQHYNINKTLAFTRSFLSSCEEFILIKMVTRRLYNHGDTNLGPIIVKTIPEKLP
jgi:hypothetical protein